MKSTLNIKIPKISFFEKVDKKSICSNYISNISLIGVAGNDGTVDDG